MANFFDRERAALLKLVEAVEVRSTAEKELVADFSQAVERAERDIARSRKANAAAWQGALAQLDAQNQREREAAEQAYQQEHDALERQYSELKSQLDQKFRTAHEKTRTTYKDRLWTIDSVLEAGLKQAEDKLESQLRTARSGERRTEDLWRQADPFLSRVRLSRGDVQCRDELPPPSGEPGAALSEAIAVASDRLKSLSQLFLPRLASARGLMVCGLIGALAAAAGSFPFLSPAVALAITIGVGSLCGIGLWLLLRRLARQRTRRAGEQLGVAIATLEAAVEYLQSHARKEFEIEKQRLHNQHAQSRMQAEQHFQPLLDKQKRAYEAERTRLHDEHVAKLQSLKEQHDRTMDELSRRYTAEREEIESRYRGELAEAERQYEARLAEARENQQRRWNETAARWFSTISDVTHDLQYLCDEGKRLFPDWDSDQLASGVPEGVRFGQFRVDLSALPEGVPSDERLQLEKPLQRDVPAYLPFPDRCSLLLRTRDEGRIAAVNLLQAIMLRFLTGLPPGKVRFTIVDPVGLGENFAAFMHLADHDEKLVTSQIWTEASQIEKRLIDLTDHIAAVIQKYLRNQYRSIEEYNRAAGEVAEPYRILVVANFPHGFTPESAKRLVSIASSGPSCGVCTLVSVDTRVAMPRDFQLADLEAVSLTLSWRDGGFQVKDAALEPFALSLDTPPDSGTIARLVNRVGQASLRAGRVEVPFSYVRPAAEEVWRGDASKGFDVPIGRAGATRRQTFRLGRGTAQHALIAGKTGSGKSTLLHAIISNLALIYSPEEAELYLIDFKKGVEFKDYAAYRLPHARVVAIESEREFGLSVLQRLDGVLRERGDLFRQAGVNDLASFRSWLRSQGAAGVPGLPQHCPRILLIVDEFQEFFVEDDKLAQEASLLLDRLVRQGRAFGLHVVLGSQSLGGAYSLPRTTIDQMAVRIALQSSEADAQLILSKDNNAARLLSRPGEAIYNDANGLVEGNDPFQVVWMSDSEREKVLLELQSRSDGRYPPPLVFEGNSSSNISTNKQLEDHWRSPTVPVVKVLTAWLGEPVAIKEPTAALFRPQSAANLLLLGQQEDAARSTFAAILLSLASQLAGSITDSPIVTLLDGTPDDRDEAEALRTLARRLVMPCHTPGRADLPSALARLTEMLDQRQKGNPDRSCQFLLVFGLQRFRELRKAEDDFGFRRTGDRESTPAERFLTLLREGPAYAIHTVLWCDSLTNLNRSLDRQGIREFGQRVLFQMSANDSSSLVDSPIASRLGPNRALFVMEEQERPEKFRPYGWPEASWLETVITGLKQRVNR